MRKQFYYKIFGTPMGIREFQQIADRNGIDAHREFMRRVIDSNYLLPYESLFLKINDDSFYKMEILFGPRMSKSEIKLLQSFLRDNGLQKNWKLSSLKIQ